MLEDSILADLDNVVEHASDEILNQVDEAVKRVIKYYRNSDDEAINLQNNEDVQLLAAHPRESLKSFYKILEVEKHVAPETDIGE